MQKHKVLFIVFIFLSLSTQSQEIKLKTYQTTDFTISYPESWETKKDGEVYNFYLDANLGDISISVYKQTDLSDDMIKEAILSINDQHSIKDTVEMKTVSGNKEYTYRYIRDGIKWIAKGIKKGKDFYFITLNWKVKDWEAYKQILTKSFDSFSIK